MTDIFSLIRRDKEFLHSVEAIREQLSANNPLPIAVNGLQGGAIAAFPLICPLEAAFRRVRLALWQTPFLARPSHLLST